MHPFYVAFRIAFATASCILFVAYSIQLYRTRRKLSEVWRTKRIFKTHRVARITGIIGSILYGINSIDFYGTFGILSTNVRVTIFAVNFGLAWFSLNVAFYHALIVTLTFMPVDKDLVARRIWRFMFVNGMVTFWTTTVSFYLENRALYLFVRFNTFVVEAMVGLASVYVYYRLRSHYRDMQKLGLSSYSSKSNDLQWTKILRKWRLYAIALSVVMIIGAITTGTDAFAEANRDVARSNVNYETDPEQIPNSYGLAFLFSIMAVLIILGWMSWRGTATDDSRNSSNNHNKKGNNSGGKNKANDAHCASGKNSSASADVSPNISQEGEDQPVSRSREALHKLRCKLGLKGAASVTSTTGTPTRGLSASSQSEGPGAAPGSLGPAASSSVLGEDEIMTSRLSDVHEPMVSSTFSSPAMSEAGDASMEQNLSGTEASHLV